MPEDFLPPPPPKKQEGDELLPPPPLKKTAITSVSPNQKTVSVGSKPLPQDGGLSPFISKPKEEKLNVGKSFTNVGRSQMGDQELPEPPRPEDPTKQLLAQQWAKKPMSKEIVEMGKTQSAMGAKPLSEKEYDTQYTEARFTLDKLPSRVKAVINENNRDEILDYLKNNPYELQRMQKWIENPKEAGLQSQEVVLNTLRGAIQSTVQKDADAIGELDRLYGTGAKISRLTALASDIDKTADELKKYQTQVEFYQNKFLENKGNAQLVNQIKAEKAAINKFDYKGFKSELDAIQKELAPMQEYLSGIEAQYPNGIPRDMYAEYQNAYTKYQSAALRYNELLNAPEYQQYQKSVDNYNNLVNQQKQLVSDFQGDSNYKKALQGYEKAREKYDLIRTEYEDIPKFDVEQYFGHAKRLSDAQGVLSSIEPAFPMAVEREKIQEKIKAFGELNPNVALTQRVLAAWETIPEAVEKVAGGALNLLSTTGKALAGYNEKDLYTLTDKYADYLNDFGKLNNTLTYEGGITNKSGDINWKSLPVEALRQIGNLAVFATVGKFTGGTGAAGMLGSTASTSAPMVSTAYFMSRMDRAKEAEQAGLQGAQKEMYVSTLSLLEGLSELIMPDAQLLTKPVKNKLLKDAVQGVSKGKNWYTKQALLTIAENSGKEAAEELVVKLGELLEKTAVNYAEGNVFNTEKYKNINDWAATALVAAPLAGVSTSISQINQPTEQMEADMYRASSDLTASRSVLDAMVEKGKITAQQADKVYKNIVRFAAVRDIIPQDISPEKAVQLVPLIEQNETIKMLLQDADDIFKPRLQKALKENIEKAQEILNSKEQIANEPITGDEIRGTDAVEEAVGEQPRISETGVEETVTEEVVLPEKVKISETKPSDVFILNGENGNIVTLPNENMVVFETQDKVIDLGTPQDISDLDISEFGIEKESLLDIETTDDYSVTIEGKRYVNNYSDPQAAINYDENGDVVSINLETEDGKKRTIRGDRANTIAYQYKLKQFEENATEESIARLENEVGQLEVKVEPTKPKTKVTGVRKSKQKPKTIEPQNDTRKGIKEEKPSEITPEGVQKPQLEPEIKSNLEKIQEETGTNFREIQNVYNKYGEGKPLNEITLEDYRAAEAKRREAKSAPKVVTSETIKEVVPEKTIEAVKALTRAKKAMTESARTKVEETAKDAPNFDKAKYIMDNLENIKAKLLESGKLTTDCKWG